MLARWPKRDRLGNTVPLDPLKRRDRNRALDYFTPLTSTLYSGTSAAYAPSPTTPSWSALTREPFTVDRLWYHRCVFISVVVVGSSSSSSSSSSRE